MATLADMRSRIADDLNRSDLDTQIDKAINRAIIFYEKEPFWFKETTGTLSTVAGTASYGTADGLPSDIKRIHYAEITISSNDYPLTEVDVAWIQRMNPQNTQGQPTGYAWWQEKLWLYLVPDAVYTVRFYYTKTYSALSANSDTNDWLDHAEDLIESRARWWIYKRIIKDRLAADDAKGEEIDALLALRDKNEDYTSHIGIVPTCF